MREVVLGSIGASLGVLVLISALASGLHGPVVALGQVTALVFSAVLFVSGVSLLLKGFTETSTPNRQKWLPKPASPRRSGRR